MGAVLQPSLCRASAEQVCQCISKSQGLWSLSFLKAPQAGWQPVC